MSYKVLISSFLATKIVLTNCQAPNTICVWNSTGDEWDRYNGEYTKETLLHNDYPWYQQTTANSNCGMPSTTKIFAASDPVPDGNYFWQANVNLFTSAVAFYPICENSNLADPTLCDADNWRMLNASAQPTGSPIQWTVTNTSCPTLPCSAIQVTNSGNSDCDRRFTKSYDKEYVYWTFATTLRYLYFNPWTFKWYCSQTNGYQDCGTDVNITHPMWSSASDGWHDVEKGESFDLQVTTGNTANFECLGSSWGTPPPTATTDVPSTTPTETSITDAPTITPTYGLTLSPTNIPTLTPTEAPITTAPTTTPTNEPTLNPTNFPTTPTKAPITTMPTTIPTNVPTNNPSQAPTFNPAVTPSKTPTNTPTITPSGAPTDGPILSTNAPSQTPLCIPDLRLIASWSESYLSISLHIKNSNTMLYIQPLSNLMECGNIFNETSNILIGENAICTVEIQTMNDILFVIDLSSTSTIGLNDILTLKRSAIHYICIGDDTLHNLSDDIAVSSISQPVQHSVPNIIISKLFTVIGVCDDLILDARSTTNLGGRSALFEWKVSVEGSQNIDEYLGSYHVIQSSSLSKGKTHNIVLSVTNWYGATSSVMFDVYVSNTVTPSVFVSGVNEYSASDMNLNGWLDMMAHVTFDDSCLLNEGASEVLNYDISWKVIIIDNNTITIDEDKWLKLNEFLAHQSDDRRAEISLNASDVLQSGFVYEFSVNIECIGDYDCNINAVHQVTVHFAAIHCKIMSNDILLNNADAIRDLDFVIALDGDTLTYDPDESASLQWGWNCVNDAQQSCDYLLDFVHTATVHMDLSQTVFVYDTHYLFTVNMVVFDTANLNRESCFDSFSLKIQTKADENEDTVFEEKTLIVTATSIGTEVTNNDRIQLVGNIVNYPLTELVEEGFVTFEWKEVNGLLTADDITSYKQTSSNNTMNLILREGVLISGQMYSFQLSVTQYDNDNMDNVIGYGLSVPVAIYILKEPKILSDSFQIEPQCTNKQYDSILDILSSPYSLSVSADADYTPLLYVFGYKYDDYLHYFDSSNIYEPFLPDLYLPIGDFNVFVDVIDTKSSTISQQISCSISLSSYSVCLDLNTVLIEPYLTNHPLLSSSETTAYVLQQSIHYLQYLNEYIPSDATDTCIKQSLYSILYLIYEYHNVYESDAAACAHGYRARLISRLLSDSITLWIDLLTTDPSFIAIVLQDTERFDMLQNILIHILDPCAYIIHKSSIVESFYVSGESMITKITKIYYGAVDITNNLSPLVIHPNDHATLYSLSAAMITLFRHIPSRSVDVLSNLLSNSLYISQLVRISLSIPYESTFTEFADFSLYSVRVKNEDVNVSLSDIDVSLPKDVTNSGVALLDAVDVMIVALNSSSNDDTATSITSADKLDSKCDDFIGTLSENAVSIIVIGNNTNTSHLSSNISLTFTCDEGVCDDTFQCAWYNKTSDLWQNEGCNKEIHYDTNSIHCSCNHLTTFSTIHNIHSYECEDNDYVAEWLRSKAWNWINLCMAVIFLCICFFTVKEILPFYRNRRKVRFATHRAVYAVILIGIAAFLYMVVYIQAFITKIAIQNGSNPAIAIKVYTLLLLLPQVVLFMLFTLIFYTWFGLAHSFMKNLDNVQKRMRYVLLAVNIFIWCFLIVYYALIFGSDDTIFRIAAYIWSAMLSIAAIFITIYSILVGRVLYKAAQISQHQSFAKQDWMTVRRLLIINAFLTLYFVFQAFSNIYLATDPQYQTVAYSSLYSSMDALCLLVLFWMYRSSLRHLKIQQVPQWSNNTLATKYRQRTATRSHDTPRTGTPLPTVNEMTATRDRTTTFTPPMSCGQTPLSTDAIQRTLDYSSTVPTHDKAKSQPTDDDEEDTMDITNDDGNGDELPGRMAPVMYRVASKSIDS